MSEHDADNSPATAGEGNLSRLISDLEDGSFEGAVACFIDEGVGPKIVMDGFGSKASAELNSLNEIFMKGGGERRFRDPMEDRNRHDFDCEGDRSRVLEAVKEIRSRSEDEDIDTAIAWIRKGEDRSDFEMFSRTKKPDKLIQRFAVTFFLKKLGEESGVDKTAFSKKPSSEGPNLDFGDVVGMSDVKEAFREMIIRPIRYPEVHEKYRVKPGGGVLLYGPPGCGKTHIARAATGELDAEFYHVKLSDVLSKWFGDSEQKIRGLFRLASRDDSAVIFFDEIDAIAHSRDSVDGPMKNVIGQLLTELDGYEKFENTMILGATNTPWSVDSALTRPGRIDRSIFVPPPGREDRRRLFEYHLEGRPVGDVDAGRLAELTHGYSCADVVEACERGLKRPLRETCEGMESGRKMKVEEASMDDFVWAVEEQGSSIGRWVETVRQRMEMGGLDSSYPELASFVEEYGDGGSSGEMHYA